MGDVPIALPAKWNINPDDLPGLKTVLCKLFESEQLVNAVTNELEQSNIENAREVFEKVRETVCGLVSNLQADGTGSKGGGTEGGGTEGGSSTGACVSAFVISMFCTLAVIALFAGIIKVMKVHRRREERDKKRWWARNKLGG